MPAFCDSVGTRWWQNSSRGAAEPGGDQLFEPQRGGCLAAGKLGHEGHARGFHPIANLPGLLGVEVEEAAQ